MKGIGSIVGVLILAFFGWIFLAADGGQRLDRSCRPIGWAGNVAVSLTAMTFSDQQDNVEEVFDNGTYACQYTLWRLFYEDAYLDEQYDEGGDEQQEGQQQ